MTTIPVQLRTLLGVPNDPHAFATAAFRTYAGPLRTVHNRVVTRTGLTSHTVVDADPQKAGNQRAKITLRSTSNDDPGKLAAKVGTMIVALGKGRLYADEVVRWATGQPIGTSKSLDDADDGDGGGGLHVSASFGFGGGVQAGAGGRARTIDPFTIGLVVTVLVAVVPLVWPMLVEWGKGAFNLVDATGSPVGPATPPAEKDNGWGGIADRFGGAFDDITGADGDKEVKQESWILLGAAALALYLILKK